MLKKYKYKIFVLFLLITAGIALQLSGLLEPAEFIEYSRQYSDNWWLMVLLVILQIVLFTFALAGSMFLWVAATLYPPLTASLVLASGAALGGVCAYYFSQGLASDWVERIETSKVYCLLQRNDNFFTLLAMRVMPAFPHAVINYSSGILKVNIVSFVIAAFLGVGLKSYVFAGIIYQAASTGSVKDLLDFGVLAPLILFSLAMFFVVYVMNRKYAKK